MRGHNRHSPASGEPVPRDINHHASPKKPGSSEARKPRSFRPPRAHESRLMRELERCNGEWPRTDALPIEHCMR
jgi:hypothetical protein